MNKPIKCPACPVEVRNLFACAKNLITLVESDNAERFTCKIAEKVTSLRDAVEMIQPIVDAHFAADHVEVCFKPEPMMIEGMPRRCRIDLATTPEKAIRDALAAVESAGASTNLTDAVVLLNQALEKVADHVEAHWTLPLILKNETMNEPINTPEAAPTCGTAPEYSPRKVTDHEDGGGLNDELHIRVIDPPGIGGASHVYSVAYGFNPGTDEAGSQEKCRIEFQNGPVKEFGVNGITQEVLLAIVLDRLRSFQAGSYSCRENALAITKIEEALLWLKKRTSDRLKRGVLGTSAK